MGDQYKTTYEINTEACVRCGICQVECPAHCIKEKDGVLVILTDRCIECGHCGAVCPKGAVTCNGEELPLVGDHRLTAEEAFDLIAGKRSVRRYESAPLSREVMEKILEAGALTGTATNSRNARAKIYAGEEVTRLRRDLCQRLLGFVNLLDNPLGRQVARWAGAAKYADPKMLKAIRKHLTDGMVDAGDPLFFHAPAVVVLTYPKSDKRFGKTNAILAGQSMMLYAHALGIESCMIGFAEMGAKGSKGKQILGIGEDREVGLIFTLGYGIPKYYRLPKRHSIAE